MSNAYMTQLVFQAKYIYTFFKFSKVEKQTKDQNTDIESNVKVTVLVTWHTFSIKYYFILSFNSICQGMKPGQIRVNFHAILLTLGS